MGGGRIFLKTFSASLFNEDLWNEPNFGQIHPSALKRKHPALQNIKFLKFFSTFVGHFCPPGSGSTDLIVSESNPDPDPKLCSYVRFFFLQGREFTLNGSPYELYSCDTCGQKGVHIGEYLRFFPCLLNFI
jgi:hypothetical protein